MESDVEKLLRFSIDIDKIKDEQNPMYQNVDIQRQRLLSVLDRAIEKVGIVYALEDMLTDNVNILLNYMTQRELDSILNLYHFARHLENSPTRNVMSIVMRSIDVSLNRSSVSTSSMTPSSNVEKAQENNLSHLQLIRSYYNYVIAKLHFIPQISILAKYIVYKKPVGFIKYYIYLKDLRDQVFQLIYETKTDEDSYKKNIKRAYVKNLKEKPQAEYANKILQDKQNEKKVLELKLRYDIEKEKLIQNEMNSQVLNEAIDMIYKSENEILARTEASHFIQEEDKKIIADRVACYNKELTENIASIQALRKKIKKLEVLYKKILEDYDSAMTVLNDDFEAVNEVYLKYEALYNDLLAKFEIQEQIYEPLKKEMKEYLEMNLLRITHNRGAKIIQRWWREILYRRWKWRKSYLLLQMKRISLKQPERATLIKYLKKIKQKEKKIQKKFNF